MAPSPGVSGKIPHIKEVAPSMSMCVNTYFYQLLKPANPKSEFSSHENMVRVARNRHQGAFLHPAKYGMDL